MRLSVFCGLHMGEFELIKAFFTRPTPRAVLGVGDDCALLQPAPGMQLAISSDMLVSGRHFFADADPYALGHKALAVNLSDLSACGAKPLAFTLALALPEADPLWLAPFAKGMLTLADAHGCELIGGDTTKGPLNICITVFGEVPPRQALLRSGARAGDDIYVSGTLGDARLALQARLQKLNLAEDVISAACLRMDRPTARLELGMALRGIASAAADISDGLLGDLGHILERSGVGATIYTEVALGLMHNAQAARDAGQDVLALVLAGGDDYELVFTAAPEQRAAVEVASKNSSTIVTRIGHIEARTDTHKGLKLIAANGSMLTNRYTSFDHFST
jgi:thiamine-monophosphate kinase